VLSRREKWKKSRPPPARSSAVVTATAARAGGRRDDQQRQCRPEIEDPGNRKPRSISRAPRCALLSGDAPDLIRSLSPPPARSPKAEDPARRLRPGGRPDERSCPPQSSHSLDQEQGQRLRGPCRSRWSTDALPAVIRAQSVRRDLEDRPAVIFTARFVALRAKREAEP
jgi:hypothetical protein